MAKKFIWFVVTILMVLSLVISCGPTKVEEKGKEEEGKVSVVVGGEEEKVVVKEKPGILPPEVPKYGGELKITWMNNYGWDPFSMAFTRTGHVYLVGQTLISGDWTKCAAGTGENDALASFAGRMEFMTGWLAESWDLPDDETIIFHIRKGVHYHNKPPVNGREVTADDVVWNIEMAFSMPKTWHYMFTVAGNNPTSIKALDKYTVELKVKPWARAMMLLEIGNQLRLMPPDGWKAGLDMNDWKNSCGAGPWMLVDWVPDSSFRYVKNPNYWLNDPLHPENQLPYPDRLLTLVITDASTREAAFRTGKLDVQYNQTWENWEMFMKQCPAMKYIQTLPDFTQVLSGRTDKPDLPFKDIRVRQALNLAINKQEIIDEYYDGHADMLAYPVKNMKAFETYFIPLEEMPESVKELFTYNPGKARKLLTEAGYPNGFKTVVQTSSAGVDYLSMIREYFLKVGVDMQIEVLESAVMSAMSTARTHKEMIQSGAKTSLPFFFWTERKEDLHNKAFWESSTVRAAYERMNQVLGVDDAEVARIMRETTPHILENAPYIYLPLPHSYTMWWPWVQNFQGEQDIGYCAQATQYTFVWIDEALKKSMGY